MGQVRMAVRAFSLEGHPPRVVVGRVHDLLRSLYEGEQMVTMLYLVVDPMTWEATIVNAGHPPPLLLDAAGGATYLAGPTGLPLGLNWSLPYEESIALLRPGCDDSCCSRTASSTGETSRSRKGWIDSARWRRMRWSLDIDDLCGVLLEGWCRRMPPTTWRSSPPVSTRCRSGSRSTSRPIPRSSGRFVATSADGCPVTTWRRRTRTTSSSPAPRRARTRSSTPTGPAKESVDIEAEVDDGEITIVIRDTGRWRAARNGDRGRGLPLIESCMDSCTFARGDEGTELRMQRRVPRSPSG